MAPGAVGHGQPEIRAWRSPAAWITLLLTLLLGLALDLGSKAWAFNSTTIVGEPVVLDRDMLLANPNVNPIPRHEGVQALPLDLLDFRLVINRGAVFGIGTDKRLLFIVFTIAALTAGIAIFAWRTRRQHHLAHIAIGLILAGGAGNLYDRMHYGVVRDFLHMLPRRHLPFNWSWPGGSTELFPWVFNVADVMLLTGMVLLMIHINRLERQRDKNRSQESDVEAESAATES
jgi:lipoprotein signal peptidase